MILVMSSVNPASLGPHSLRTLQPCPPPSYLLSAFQSPESKAGQKAIHLGAWGRVQSSFWSRKGPFSWVGPVSAYKD